MDLKLIRNLVRIMERGEVNELEIDDEKAGTRIRLRRGEGAPSGATPVVVMPGGPALAPVGTAGPESGDGDELPADVVEVHSPMVGTFYRSQSPEADPFVSVGAPIEEETVVCIIEAMKVMNEIKAECRGKIVEILVDNGEPVEYGQPILLVKTR